jgi:nitrogen fixation/metabolism regulation signal transduction histidine kinase
LRAYNNSAVSILDTAIDQLTGVEPERWHERVPALAELAGEIAVAFGTGNRTEWEKQLGYAGRKGEQMLLLRGTQLPAGSATGYVVVFDDITHVLQSQRDAAWTEVARRLAHEIKNPLTPIQLSAERLQMKLSDKLAGADADMLSRSTTTIVNQVAALKNMVDAFRQYARMPEPSVQTIDLNALMREVLTLYESHAAWFHLNFAADLPLLVGDPAQLRQVMHNLLQNAQDSLVDATEPRIEVRSERVEGGICVTITDNGAGFPETLMKRAFEPYVTTKPKGTGLGLVIVKKIVEEHNGTVGISNISPHGARVTLTFATQVAQKTRPRAAANA